MTIATPVNATMPREARYAWTSEGRLRDDATTEHERNLGLLMHLSPLGTFVLTPAVFLIAPIVWLVKRDDSPYLDDHGREFINYWLSFLVFHLLLGVTVVFAFLIPVLWIVAIVSMIRASIATSRNEIFRYPMTIRFLGPRQRAG